MVLLLTSSSFLICIRWFIFYFIHKEDPLQIFRVHILCSIFFRITVLRTAWSPWTLSSVQSTHGTHWIFPTFPFLILQPENSVKAIRSGIIRAYLICFFSLRDRCTLLPDAKCLDNNCSYILCMYTYFVYICMYTYVCTYFR